VSGVAAALVVAAGMFAAGRVTAPVTEKTVEVPKVVYSMVYENANGEIAVSDLNSIEERNARIRELEKNGPSGMASSDDLLEPGSL
jgi:hypothetical protein